MMFYALLIAFFAVTAQEPASVRGVVVKAGTNEPILNATVELRRTGSGDPRTYTAGTQKDGRFEFRAVPAGQYELSASHSGYVKATYGERRLEGPGRPILVPDEVPTDLRLVMTRTGVISGRVLDAAGQPLVNATVSAMKVSYAQGVNRQSGAPMTVTNDLGEYRLFWLTPGRYYVSATPTVGPRRGVGTGPADADRFLEFRIQPETTTAEPRVTDEVGTNVYFPGTFDRQSATPVDVMPGAEVRRIDFIATPVRTRHIRGVVVSAEPGQALTGSPRLGLFGQLAARISFPPMTTFDLSGIFPGKYVLSAELNDMSGHVPVEVRDQDLNDVVVPISRGFSLSGRVVVEGATASNPGPDLQSLRLTFRPDPNTGMFPAPATPGADGSFIIQPLYSGNYRIVVGPPLQNAYLKAIRFEDRDVLETGLLLDRAPSNPATIVISANAAVVTGTVMNDKQQPVPNAVVALVPERDRRSNTQLFKNATTDRTGQFRIQAITPGNYKLFAWQDVENGAWQNAEFLSMYEERGTPLEIAEGETKTVSLQSIVD
jgi:protocatechuate 3,4-dioxygenase beta subunit